MATENKDVVMDTTSAEASTSTVADVRTDAAPPALPESLKGKTDEEIDEVKQKIVAQRECSRASVWYPAS